MIAEDLKKLIDNPGKVDELNNLIHDWVWNGSKVVLENNDIALLNNSVYLVFYYGLLLKWLVNENNISDILYYLDTWYKNLETSFFNSKAFLDLLTKVEINNTWLSNNQYIKDILQKNDDSISYKEWELIWSKIIWYKFFIFYINTRRNR